MVTVETNSNRTNGVTTVRIVVTNTYTTPQTVRLQCCLEAPLWVPRRDGVVDPRWNDGSWEISVRPDRSRGIGFASPNPPTEPLVEVVSSDRYDTTETDPTAHSSAAVLAELDRWSPTSTVLERKREREP